MTKSVSDKIREVLVKHTSEMLDNPDEYGIYPSTKFYNTVQAAFLKIIEEDVIGEDKKHAPVDTLGIWSHDIANFEYNQLRAEQRSKLKGEQ